MTSNLLDQSRVLIGPYEISFDITNRCNYRCLHCYNASGENVISGHELSDDEVLRLMEDIATLMPQNICFCGGEPLIRKDLICDSIDILKRGGMNTFSMVSNGYFATEDVLSSLVCHGLNRFQVSLDGASNESCFVIRQYEYAYDKAVTAIRNARKVGLKDISVAFCPTKYNMGELEDVIKQCVDLGVANLRIQPLMMIGRASRNVEKILPSRNQYVTFIQNIRGYQSQYSSQINIEWGDPLDHIFRYKDMMKDQNIFVSIRSDGSICPSPYLPISVGNIRHHKLSEYWEYGLCRAWSIPAVKDLADRVMCIGDMSCRDDGTPETWFDNNISMDIIDENVFGRW